MSLTMKQGTSHRGYVRTTRPVTKAIKKPVTTLRRTITQTNTSSTAMAYGNASQWHEFSDWLKSTARSKCLLLIGPTGCGKTHMTYAKAAENGRRVYEINASDITSKEQLMEDLHRACTCTLNTLGERGEGNAVNCKNLVLLDGVDGFTTDSISTIDSFLRGKNRPSPCEPVVFTCTPHAAPFAIKLLRALCTKVIYLNPIDDNSLRQYAKCKFPNKLAETVDGAARKCKGDLRQFIMYLEYAIGTCIDSKCGLWDTVAATFRQDARARQLCGYHEPDTVHRMLFENYLKSDMSGASLKAKEDRMESLKATADAFSVMDIIRSGSVRSLKAEAWELGYRLPLKINIAPKMLTYTPRILATRTFPDFKTEFLPPCPVGEKV